MKRFLIVAIFFLCTVFYSLGQEKISDPEDGYKKLETRYQFLKDSLSKTYQFIPAVSSVILEKGQFEIIYFSSILTANKFRDDNGNLDELNVRSTYFYNTLQLTYGFSKNRKWNVGFDINSISARVDDDRNSSIFKVFGSDEIGNSRYARAINSFGPRLRWNPFQRTNQLTLQSSMLFPTSISLEKQGILGQNQIYLLTQLLYNKPLSERMFLFSQLGFQYGFKKEEVFAKFYPTLTSYVSYFLPKRTILFLLLNYTPIFINDENWNYAAGTFQVGGGVQYQISKNFLINAYYSNNIAGSNYQDFDGYTVSLRFVTN